MTHSVIICRAEPGASQSAENVARLGLVPLKTPALTIQSDPEVSLPPLHSVGGLIFTSANGVRAFALRRVDRTLRAWCVGPATAEAARDAGFLDVAESVGNSEDLAAFIVSDAPDRDRPLLHIANAAASGRLSNALTKAGYAVDFRPIYKAVPANALSDAASSALASDAPLCLLVHSQKGGEAFSKISAQYDLSALAVIAISELAASPFLARDLKSLHIAKKPTEAGLMTALKDAAATLSA